MNVLPLFSSFFASEMISDELDNTELCNSIRLLEKSDTSFRYEGGWQSGFVDPHTSCLAPLTLAIEKRLEGFANMVNLREQDRAGMRVENCWININDQHSQFPIHNNPPHQHANYWLSFVYYVQGAHNCGSLHLISPLDVQEWALPGYCVTQNNVYNSTRWTVTPEPGLLVAFPSWVKHYVDPNHSNKPRISCAFNVTLPHQQYKRED